MHVITTDIIYTYMNTHIRQCTVLVYHLDMYEYTYTQWCVIYTCNTEIIYTQLNTHNGVLCLCVIYTCNTQIIFTCLNTCRCIVLVYLYIYEYTHRCIVLVYYLYAYEYTHTHNSVLCSCIIYTRNMHTLFLHV